MNHTVLPGQDRAETLALTLVAKAESVEALAPLLEPRAVRPGLGEVLVEVRAAGVNMSDVKASLGHMPYAVWPRIPGRDFAGVVIEGPQHLVGQKVWGSSGNLGIRRDGTHARHLILAEDEVARMPGNLSFEEAGAIGVPFVTAEEGFRRAGGVKPTDTVLVLGANGKVGQAAVQLATLAGARVIGVGRREEPYQGHATGDVPMLDATKTDVAARVREATGGKGADLVYNTVGSPYFEVGCASMALWSRHILIATLDRAVPFDIFRFFRGNHSFLGVDSLAIDTKGGKAILDRLLPEFERGALKPFPVTPSACFPLAEAKAAFDAVWRNSRDRVVLLP